MHQETVHNGAVDRVDVVAGGEVGVHVGLGRGMAPDDALVQVGYADALGASVVFEKQLILSFRHVVHRDGLAGVENVHLSLTAVGAAHGGRNVALGQFDPCGGVAKDADGAEVNQVAVEAKVSQRNQHRVGGCQVVGDGVVPCGGGQSGVGGRTLLGQMDNRAGANLIKDVAEPIVVLRDVDLVEGDLTVCDAVPRFQTVFCRLNGKEGRRPKFLINAAARQVVEDRDVVAVIGEAEGDWPSAEAVAAKNQNMIILQRTCHATLT